ncbi:MAG: energy-coupling factor transporter ATPase [Bifidobacterium thermacidophilum]|jgi:energy-coupling factor transporter ATP-binding protein EcfA2/energy-coupling factor transporter transmembrane protein EcfT|uniref:energy-coupling factor transporter ATPase n=1 Tax=Bifidobacterium thermacidophilum TaxID=246618 RepID=UPI002F356CEC
MNISRISSPAPDSVATSTPASAQVDANANDRQDLAASLRRVRYRYSGAHDWALDGVDLDIHAGEYVCIVGANGSGKSTLARLLAGLSAPDSGVITLDGHPVFDAAGAHADQYRLARHDIGAVFQNPEDQIVTTITGDDVAFGPENLGMSRLHIGDQVAHALKAVGMMERIEDDPTTMSGGQQQRIAIAGIIAMNPAMVVLDEPTAMLDQDARIGVLDILDALHRRGATIVHVTHHADEAHRGQRVITMSAGRIINDSSVATPSLDGYPNSSEHPAKDDFRHLLQTSGMPVTWLHPGSIDGRTPLPSGTSLAQGTMSLAAATPMTAGTDAAGIPGTGSPDAEEIPAAHPSAPAISVDHVSFTPQGAASPSVDRLTFSVRSGETVALMGTNGAGKTTLIRLLAALDRPDSGNITIDGIPVATDYRRTGNADERRLTQPAERLKSRLMTWLAKPRSGVHPLSRAQRVQLRHRLGLVMQHPERQLFAQTVAEDVAYGPRNLGLSEQEVAQRVDEALELLHIGDIRDRSPFSLSGGQQRLAAIAGVIACHPDVLLLDEPTASLDETASARIRGLLADLHRRGGTVLLVTHSIDEARAVADRVLVLESPANAQQKVTPQSADEQQPADTLQSEASAAASSDGIPAIPSANTADIQPSKTRRTGTGRSAIGKLDTRVKVVAFLSLMFSAFAISSPYQLAVGTILTAGIVAAARISPLQLLARIHMFLFLFVFAGALNIFFVRTGTPLAHIGPVPITDDGVHTAIIYACRFALVIILGAVYVETTTPTAMTDAFESLLSPLKRCGIHVQEIALVLSLALRFLPTLRVEIISVAQAQAARGGSIESGSPAQRCRAMCAIIMPVFAASLRHADNLSLALDARSYEEGIHRTHWHEMRMHARDGVFCAACAVYVAALVLVALL